MNRFIASFIAAAFSFPPCFAEPIPKGAGKFSGIIVLDNCDPIFKDKDKYEDNVTVIDSVGKLKFRIKGFNSSQTIGGMRKIAIDSTRISFWVFEDAAYRIRKFDFDGKESLTINDIRCSAIAVNPETGHLWVVTTPRGFGTGPTVVYDRGGKLIATYDEANGTDIVYDKKDKAFWIAGKELTKVSAVNGKVLVRKTIATWTASSLDVDSRTGDVWVGIRMHPQVAGSDDRLMKLDSTGKEVVSVGLEGNSPWQVSADSTDGSVWVAAGKMIRHYSKDGKLVFEKEHRSYGVQVEPGGKDVWVVTPDETQKMTSKGEITFRIPHASKTIQAWIASVE